jgi:hypothetical protein
MPTDRAPGGRTDKGPIRKAIFEATPKEALTFDAWLV